MIHIVVLVDRFRRQTFPSMSESWVAFFVNFESADITLDRIGRPVARKVKDEARWPITTGFRMAGEWLAG